MKRTFITLVMLVVLSICSNADAACFQRRPVRRVVSAVVERQPIRSAIKAVVQRRPVRAALGAIFTR